MDRLFLDASVLFSTAYQEDAGLRQLRSLEQAELLTSGYALEEARRNLATDEQRRRLARLAADLELVPETPSGSLPDDLDLPEKDRPIVSAAVQAGSTRLVTGDLSHFGPYLGRTVAGIRFVRPAELL